MSRSMLANTQFISSTKLEDRCDIRELADREVTFSTKGLALCLLALQSHLLEIRRSSVGTGSNRIIFSDNQLLYMLI